MFFICAVFVHFIYVGVFSSGPAAPPRLDTLVEGEEQEAPPEREQSPAERSCWSAGMEAGASPAGEEKLDD